MKAKNISGQMPGGKRTKLADVVPLDTPYVVQVFPIYACNFRCNYCLFSIDKNKRGFVSDKSIMDFELYKKFVDDLLMFPNKIKVLRIVGIGEPLLHKNIADMIKYAIDKNAANITELLTNASLLTPVVSNSLISAGLARLMISLQGTTKGKYKKVCRADIDFNEFVGNIEYFYKHKTNTQMYIKIIDCALDGKKDEEKFYKIFGNICDTIAVECAVPIHSGIDYKSIIKDRKEPLTQFGRFVTDINVCPQPFFTMQINPDGKVVPCYSFEYPGIMGDCNTQSMKDIWDSSIFTNFRKRMLNGRQEVSSACRKCNIMRYRVSPEDVLDNDVEKIRERYKEEK